MRSCADLAFDEEETIMFELDDLIAIKEEDGYY
jgi:hypothetical protein